MILNSDSKKIEGPKHYNQNRLRSPMPEGGETLFYFKIITFKKCTIEY